MSSGTWVLNIQNDPDVRPPNSKSIPVSPGTSARHIRPRDRDPSSSATSAVIKVAIPPVTSPTLASRRGSSARRSAMASHSGVLTKPDTPPLEQAAMVNTANIRNRVTVVPRCYICAPTVVARSAGVSPGGRVVDHPGDS